MKQSQVLMTFLIFWVFFQESFPGREHDFLSGGCFWDFLLGVSVLMGGIKKS